MNRPVTTLTVCGVIGACIGIALYAGNKSPDIPTITEWEHGYKTDKIIATRYKNPYIGYNIGFRYLSAHDDSNADTTRVSDFFERRGCGIVQGGGRPFSEYFVVCKGVIDQTSANLKLKTLLPELADFMRTQ